MKLWHVAEQEGVDSSDPRVDWFPNKRDAVSCQKRWLSEHADVADEGEDVSERVKIERIEVPTSRDALARWLFAYDVKAI
jgi:hypothetical protein